MRLVLLSFCLYFLTCVCQGTTLGIPHNHLPLCRCRRRLAARVNLESPNLVGPLGSRSRASTALQTPTPPASESQAFQRRSLTVIEERPQPTPNRAPLSAYARIVARFRRHASADHVPPPPEPKPGPSAIRPRRTLRKRTSNQPVPQPQQAPQPQTQPQPQPQPQPHPSTPPRRPPPSRESSKETPRPRRISPVRRPTSPVPFNPPAPPPPAPIPVPPPVSTPPRRSRTRTVTDSVPTPDMYRPASPQPTKQSLKTWWKHFKQAQSVPFKKDPDELVKNAPHKVFGIPLRESLRYASVQISTANPQGELYVWGYIPVVVAKCGLFLKENATEVEGVFRVNGSNRRMRDLQGIFESPPRYGKDLNWKHESYTSHDVASVFRRYLTQMPEPVIPTEQYHNFRAALAKQPRDEAEVIHIYRKLIKDMPRANQYLLLYVLDLLSVFARKADKNLMTESNLAVIFRPGIISHPSHEMQPQEHALSQEVLVFLIQHQDHFMLDPPARGDSIMLSGGMTPGLSPNERQREFSPAPERTGYIVPSDSDEEPPPGGWKLVERRRDPTTGSLIRRRSLNDPSLTPTLTTEPESIGSDSPVGSTEGGKVKRSRTVPSQRGASVLEGGKRRATKRLDTLGSVGSTAEAGLGVEKGASEIDRERDVPTPTSTTAVVNAVPPPEKVVSQSEKVVSKPERVVSQTDKVVSKPDKVVSQSDKVVSKPEKVVS